MDEIFSVSNLVNLGLIFYCLGLMARDELLLRGLLLCGTISYAAYYLLYPDPPLWNAAVNNGLIIMVNLTLIAIIIHERTLWAMAEHELQLFDRFGHFTPGQFRKLMRAAEWIPASERIRLTSFGEIPDKLYFVVSGNLCIEKPGGSTTIPGDKFIGEIAYLRGEPASATVVAEPGAMIVAWDKSRIRALTANNRALDHAITVMLSHDMAGKVASSMPISTTSRSA